MLPAGGVPGPRGDLMGVDRTVLAAELGRIVADGRDDAAALAGQLCVACAAALPVDGVGISLLSQSYPGGQALLGCSDAAAGEVERLQFELGEGPCLTAFAEARPVLADDLHDAESRRAWPVFTAEAAEQGLAARAVFAFPLQLGAIGFGVLDCYRATPGPLTDIDAALLVVETVTLAVLDTQVGPSAGNTGGALVEASWRSHAEVHQATGMISSQLGIEVEEAFARLRAHAFTTRQPLSSVAADVLARRLRFTDPE